MIKVWMRGSYLCCDSPSGSTLEYFTILNAWWFRSIGRVSGFNNYQGFKADNNKVKSLNLP